jgi:uncharacterized delta-60 repeat protein
LNANGALDPSFNGTGFAAPENGLAIAGAVDRVGRVVVMGASTAGSPFVPFVRRYLPNGHLDASFGTGGTARIADAGNVSGLAVDASNRVVFAGNGPNTPDFVERLAANGTPDPGFGTNGRAQPLPTFLRAVAVQDDGRIVVAGVNGYHQIALTRFLPNGVRDTSFGRYGTANVKGLAAQTTPADLKVVPGGRLLVVGSGGNRGGFVNAFGVAVMLQSDGHLDTNFACAGAAWSNITNESSGAGFQSVAYGFPNAAFVVSAGTTSTHAVVQRLDLNSSGPNGYAIAASDGETASFGSAAPCPSVNDRVLRQPLVGLATTPSGRGRWLVASDGGVFPSGDARFSGSAANLVLNRPIVGAASTTSGHGYWLVASDGGIFSYGDARFFGSTGGLRLNRPIVGMAATPSGHGYWLVASDGGVFSYGDARFFGSTGGLRLNRPIVGIAATHTGDGYWLVASDGGIFSYGRAPFRGSAAASPLDTKVIGIAATP